MSQQHQTSIWYFLGVLLLIYTVLFLGAGVWSLVSSSEPAALFAEPHRSLWLGAPLLLAGAAFLYYLSPRRQK